MKCLIVLLGMLMLFLTGCGSGNNTPSGKTNSTAIQMTSFNEVVIPDGYTLIEASAYGRFSSIPTLYIRQNENGRVYEYEDGKIGAEIITPEGYTLVAVSAYGEFENIRTFYYQRNGTNKVFIFSPK